MSDNRLSFVSPITPPGRDAFYSSIPVVWSDSTDCIICLTCARDTSTEPVTNEVVIPKPVRVYPEQMLYTNSQQVVTCDLGGSYTVPAGLFGSNTSQAEADAQAVTYGTNICSGNYWNTEQTASCPSGYTGTPVTVSAHTFYSPVSQSAANSLALDAATAALSCTLNPGIPDVDICGPQNWPTVASGLPYNNTGNNTTGWVHLGGDGDFASDGTIITMLDNSISSYISITPVVGNFSLSCEIFFSDATNADFTVAMMDADSKVAIGLQLSPAGSDTPTNYFGGNCEINATIPFGLFEFTPPISVASDIPVSTWVTITLARVGSVLTASINGNPLVYDCQSTVKMRLGFGAYGVGNKSVKNIVIS